MADDDDSSGYGKPPKQHQFKPAQSGNPKGRKKGARGLKTDLKAELNSRVTIAESGRTFSLTKQQIIIKSLATKAAKGDVRAANAIVVLTIQMFGIDDERTGKMQLSANDQAILADYLTSNAGPSGPPSDWSAETPPKCVQGADSAFCQDDDDDDGDAETDFDEREPDDMDRDDDVDVDDDFDHDYDFNDDDY